MAKQWTTVILNTRNPLIPRVCPNCIAAAEVPVKCTSHSGHISGGMLTMTQTFYYCESCAEAAKVASKLRWVFLMSFFIPVPIPPFGVFFYFWYKGKQKSRFPKRTNQAVWGHAAKISHMGMLFGGTTYAAARPEWLEKLKELNENSLLEKEAQAAAVYDIITSDERINEISGKPY